MSRFSLWWYQRKVKKRKRIVDGRTIKPLTECKTSAHLLHEEREQTIATLEAERREFLREIVAASQTHSADGERRIRIYGIECTNRVNQIEDCDDQSTQLLNVCGEIDALLTRIGHLYQTEAIADDTIYKLVIGIDPILINRIKSGMIDDQVKRRIREIGQKLNTSYENTDIQIMERNREREERRRIRREFQTRISGGEANDTEAIVQAAVVELQKISFPTENDQTTSSSKPKTN